MSDIKELVKRLRTFAQGCRDSMWQSRSETIRLMDEAANALEAMKTSFDNYRKDSLIDTMAWEGRAEAAEAEVARLREIVADIPAALNSHFGAGIEERENGSVHRQARLMERGEELIRRARAALSEGKVEEMCLARRNPPPGDIQDCDWPWCHCDPHAAKVIAALEEQGCLDTNPLARIRAMGGEEPARQEQDR